VAVKVCYQDSNAVTRSCTLSRPVVASAEIYRAGIADLNDYCRGRQGDAFANLSDADQDAVLTDLQNDQIKLTDAPTKWFFKFLLKNTREGYFADPKYGGNYGMAAWVYIGFPGARASFREWVGQYDRPYPLGPVSISGERA